MNSRRLLALAALALLAWPCASAWGYWRVGIGIGVPVYHRPYYRVYVAPPPVYYVQPVPVYVQPAPVYVAPAPAPVAPAPAPQPTLTTVPVSPAELPAQPVPIR